MKTISDIIGGAQALLDISFELQDCFEESLTNDQKTFLHVLRVVEEFMPPIIWDKAHTGRPPYPLRPFIRSMFAKNMFHIEKTSRLRNRLISDPNLRLLCDFQNVPSESTFSRNLAFLSTQDIFEQTHAALVKKAHENKVVYHVCRDSSAIAAREKAVKVQTEKEEKAPKKRGRPAKNTVKPPKEPTELEKQITEEPNVSIGKLNKNCAWGCKKNSEGHIHVWKGYKLHLDVSDLGFPLTACVTAANVHDSQLAIPMEKLTREKVQFLYSLMDAGYDAQTIDAFIRGEERVPIIDPNKRGNKERPPLDPAKKERYKIRTTVERSYSHLKDHLIPKNIYVKGHTKITFVLMAAVLCLSALKYLQYFTC